MSIHFGSFNTNREKATGALQTEKRQQERGKRSLKCGCQQCRECLGLRLWPF